MTAMEAVRAEVEDWATKQAVEPSHEVMTQFYTDSLDGGTPEELASLSIDALAALLDVSPASMAREDFVNAMAIWCSAVLLGVRAGKRAAA